MIARNCRQRLFFSTSIVISAAAVSNIHALIPSSSIDFGSKKANTHRSVLSIRSVQTTSVTQMSSSSSSSSSSSGRQLFLFDFDGVVCDSCDECTVSALRTCRKLNLLQYDDEEQKKIPEYPPQWLFNKMREIRPAIEVGWQIPVLLAVFWNTQGGKSVEEILANYETLVATSLQTWGKTDQDMIDAFGTVRDAWIQDDLQSWLNINTFYPGVPQALADCTGEAILVTTKQQRFAIALCRHAGVDDQALPNDCIYGLGQYKKKADVIVDRMQTGNYAPQSTLFFEDRWPTLAKCLKDPRLDGVKLHLCSWGYVTPEELALANAEPRVKVLSLEDFTKLVSTVSS